MIDSQTKISNLPKCAVRNCREEIQVSQKRLPLALLLNLLSRPQKIANVSKLKTRRFSDKQLPMTSKLKKKKDVKNKFRRTRAFIRMGEFLPLTSTASSIMGMVTRRVDSRFSSRTATSLSHAFRELSTAMDASRAASFHRRHNDDRYRIRINHTRLHSPFLIDCFPPSLFVVGREQRGGDGDQAGEITDAAGNTGEIEGKGNICGES